MIPVDLLVEVVAVEVLALLAWVTVPLRIVSPWRLPKIARCLWRVLQPQ